MTYQLSFGCICFYEQEIVPATEYFDTSTVIFEGIVEKSYLNDKGKGIIRFKILQKFKSFATTSNTVEIYNSTPSSCGISLSDNVRVIVAAYMIDNEFHIDQCSYIHTKDEASNKKYQQDIEFLLSLKSLPDGETETYAYDFVNKKTVLVLKGTVRKRRFRGMLNIYNADAELIKELDLK